LLQQKILMIITLIMYYWKLMQRYIYDNDSINYLMKTDIEHNYILACICFILV
jgi:hypothetical protein